MKISVFLILFLVLYLPAHSAPQEQPEDIRFIKNIAFNILKSRTSGENMNFLTKNIGGRLSGSPGIKAAEDWGTEMFRKAGADSVWRQPCVAAHWERGGTDSAFISYADRNGNLIRKRISVLALGGSVGTGISGLKTRLVRIGSFQELDSIRSDFKGNIVFFNPGFKADADPIGEYSRLSAYRTKGSSAASAYGAAGSIVRSLTNSIDSFPHIGTQVNDKNSSLIPAVAVSTTDANFLDGLFDEGRKIEAEIYTHGKNYPEVTGYNIIGELKGKEFPDRYITVGAHLDSWDISEGASDDGTGVIITIELMRALKESGYKPKNTIRFVLFADEENGIHGGIEYAKSAAEKKEKHIFAIESDAGAFSPFSIGTEGVSAESIDKLKGFSSLFTPYNGGTWVTRGAADITPLNQTLNVPIASLWSDQQKYFKVHHSAADLLEKTDTGQIKYAAVNIAILLYLVEKYNIK